MAQVRQDNVQIKLDIDGSQSKTELDNLTRKALVLTQGLKEMKKGTDEYIAANKELREVNTRIAELRDEIGLTGLSTNQLGKLMRDLKRELDGLVPGTAAYIAKSEELVSVENRLREVRTGLDEVRGSLDNSGNSFASFVKKAVGFAGIQLGVEAIVGGLKDLGTESVAEFEQAQGAAAQLEAALTSTGGAAGLTKQELLDLSTALEGKTILDGDAITQAQSVLLTFTKIKKGVYEEALPAIVDMATRLGGDGPADLQGATIQVGKALNDPIKGITALGKAGVSFSEDQKVMIKSLVETGDVAGAQKIILQELKTEFAGSAEAAAQAGTGPLKQFEIQIGNVKEGLGELIVDGLQALRPVLTAGLQLFAFFIELLKATPTFISENRAVLIGLGVAILTLNAANIAAAASTLYFAAVEKGRAAATTASAVAQRLLNAAMTANPIGLVIAAVALLIGGLVTLYEKSERVREVVAGLGAAAGAVFRSIKEQAVQYLLGLGNLLAGIFTFDPAQIKAGLAGLGDAFKKTGSAAASAYRQGYAEQEKAEQAAQDARDKQQQAAKVQQAKENAAKVAAATTAASLEALKAREANIRAALALVEAGSAEELRLKKLLVTTKRDIDLLDEKKTAGDKKVIVAEALRDLRQLQDDYDKKTKEAAEKRAKEQAEVEKKIADLKAALLTDETEKRVQQLTAAAQKEEATAKGTAEQVAEQRKLIEAKLAVDVAEVRRAAAQKEAESALEVEKLRNTLIKNEFDRHAAELITANKEANLKILDTDLDAAAKRKANDDILVQALAANEDARVRKHQEIAQQIDDIERGIAVTAAQNRKNDSSLSNKERVAAADEERQLTQEGLDLQRDAELSNAELTGEQESAINDKYNAIKKDSDADYAKFKQELIKQTFEDQLELANTTMQGLADIAKIGSDKDLALVEKDKKARLAKLEAEYKAGTISKENYEAGKAAIETNYDAKTRAIKKQAAEKEKEYAIAEAVIQTALSIVKASPNPYLMAAAAITGAVSVAKIVSTDIPEFEEGGVFGGSKPSLAKRIGRAAGQAWRGVKEYARGGRINSHAGVADVGQRHSGGGIRMVDGATGEHLGEWEKGEAYMILSRDTYANNRELVDELIDTSLHRGGAPVRQRDGYYEDGGTFTSGDSSGTSTVGSARADSQELLQAVRQVETAIKALPSWVRIYWDQDDTAAVETLLDERAADRAAGEVR